MSTFFTKLVFDIFRKGFSLAEAINMVFDENLDGDVFIEPPDPNIDSDADSADEDSGG